MAAALVLALGASCGDSPGADGERAPSGTPPPLNLVVITIDTLRADHVGAFGHPHPTTPRIDALAARGAVFTQAIATSSWTRASMASVMTGLYPTATGLTCHNFRVPQGDCDVLSPGLTTFAELFAEAGYDTAGIVANINVDPVFGFDQGFAEYVFAPNQLLGEARGDDDAAWRQRNDWLRATTDKVTASAIDWLDGRAADAPPFLLYLHYLDPHDPYEPSAPQRDAFTARTYAVDARSRDEIALYDGEIRDVDTALGRVFDRLEQAGLTDTTGIVILSDHGEEFHEHGATRHGFTMYDEQLRVPLVVTLPGVGRPGTRVDAQVSLIDVAPTLLDAAGLKPPKWMLGRSLLPFVRRPDLEAPRPVLAERGYNPLAAWRRPPWKLIHDTESGTNLLFDLDADPGELLDLSAQQPGVVAELLGELRLAFETNAALASRVGAGDGTGVIELSPEQLEQLRALGYVDVDER